MTDTPLSPTTQKVLELLQQNRGTAYASTDVCEVADCSTGQATEVGRAEGSVRDSPMKDKTYRHSSRSAQK